MLLSNGREKKKNTIFGMRMWGMYERIAFCIRSAHSVTTNKREEFSVIFTFVYIYIFFQFSFGFIFLLLALPIPSIGLSIFSLYEGNIRSLVF